MTTQSLISRVELAADRRSAITFEGGERPQRVTWNELHHDARAMAAGMQARGVNPGDHVAILGPTSRSLVTAIQASWLCGAAAVVLPLPMRLASIEAFVAQTRARVLQADAVMLLADPELAPFYEAVEGDPPLVLLSEVADREAAYVRPLDDPDALAILQFTSGSTADPKGVMLPHRTVCANVDAICTAGLVDVDDDVFVSWLPLYHDMGLIGLLTMPMAIGGELVLAAPTDFLASPGRWMDWMSTYGGTATAGPNFSYALAARALRRAGAGSLDLSRWRVGLNGAEPIDCNSVDAFVAAGAPHGMRPGSVFPAFGMAEATLAVTFPPPLRGLVDDVIDRRVLETDRYAAPSAPDATGSRRMARLGTAVPGLEIRIVDPETGRPTAAREVGELEVRGTSVTPGYYQRPDATAATFRDGWLRTGDLAYKVDGELVVCGRIKDVIIVGGRNIYPEEIERAVGRVEGVRAGNVIAFGVDGRRGSESVVVVAETRTDDPTLVTKHVAATVVDTVGLPAKEVVLVTPGTLPKTSSGKLQRSLCRTRWQSGELVP